jgi:hypothetical protein
VVMGAGPTFLMSRSSYVLFYLHLHECLGE